MTQVVWSVIWMLGILLAGTGVVIYYILMYDEWYPNGSDDTTQSEELLQLPSNEYR